MATYSEDDIGSRLTGEQIGGERERGSLKTKPAEKGERKKRERGGGRGRRRERDGGRVRQEREAEEEREERVGEGVINRVLSVNWSFSVSSQTKNWSI